jgi:hypothetical protein
MNIDGTPDIPAEVAPYLDEIAERLWSGHAAVMVGSGFSKNARKAIPSAPSFPSWHELGDCLHEKLHGWKPDDRTHHYLNPLKLADEVRAAFGASALDQLVRTHIPDKEHEPSDLHVRLLKLPWTDVFTTNYDTLLERATSKVTSRRFNVVVNKEDLVYSNRPRIVKLHGSLPSTRPFVVSEEDYRRYPRECAPFVNTVQQALIESTLCLIGFSAGDPNFLHWIGWVRDNLGANNSPRMYLIGLPRLTAAQRVLLDQRNIASVDLAQCPGVGEDHGRAFSAFFDYLARKEPAPLDWPGGEVVAGHTKPKTIEELTDAWRYQRDSYPNWVVAPESSRESVWSNLRSEGFGLRFLNAAAPVELPRDISFLYELNWRFDLALRPLMNELIPHYERILDRYRTFLQSLRADATEVSPEQEQVTRLDQRKLTAQWLDVTLSLLRSYREDGMVAKCRETNRRLEALKDHLSPEQVARWFYERCLSAVFALDLAETRAEIGRWPANATLPFWEAKRAGLMAELGDIADAQDVLENALTTIRSNQQLSPVADDLTWVSQESHVMHLLHLVKMAREWAEHRQTTDEKTRQEFQQRWNELKQYKCDPWNDLELFEARLQTPSAGPDTVTRNRQFDIGRETVTRHIGTGEDGPLLGYSFLRYCEEVGLPFALSSLDIAKSQAQNAAARIAEWSSAWAVVTMLRTGDAKLADSFFGRSALARMKVSDVDEHVDHFISVLRAAQPSIAQGDRFRGKNAGVRIGHVIPEILSRLCTKCSPSRLGELLRLLRELYDSPTPTHYDDVDHLTVRLLGSMSAQQQREKVRELLEFPILGRGHPMVLDGLPEPFGLVRVTPQPKPGAGDVRVDRETVDRLLAKVASQDATERRRACARVEKLRELGLLDETQSAAFGKALWDQVGPDGFPSHAPFRKWAFHELPIPAGVDSVGLLKSYVSGFLFDSVDAGSGGLWQVTESGKRPVTMTGGDIPFFSDLLEATKRQDGSGFIDWSTAEAIVLLDKLVAWWDAGKDRLRENGRPSLFGDIPTEFRARYRNLARILAEVVAPRLTVAIDSEVKDHLKRLLEELDAYGQPALWALASCIPVFPDGKDSVLARIGTAMATSDRSCVVDALEGVRSLALMDAMRAEADVQRLVAAVGQQIKWRRDVTLKSCMTIMQTIAEKAPERLTNDVMADMLAGLEHLSRESDPRAAGPCDDVDDRLNRRKGAAALARSLYENCVKAKTTPPAILLDWKRICADLEEFAEIRNQWER